MEYHIETCDANYENSRCVVVDGGFVLYTNNNSEEAKDLVLSIVKEHIDSGAYVGSNLKISSMSYRGERIAAFGTSGNDSAGSTASNSDIFSGQNVIGSFLIGFLAVVFVAIIVLTIRLERKRRRKQDDSTRQRVNWFSVEDESQSGAFPVNMVTLNKSYDTTDIASGINKVRSYSSEYHAGDDADSDGWERADIPAPLTPESATRNGSSSNSNMIWGSENSAHVSQNEGIEMRIDDVHKRILGINHHSRSMSESERRSRSAPDTIEL